jgi:hypothetical protein
VFAEQWWWHDVNLNTSVFSFISVQSKGKDIKNQATILVGRNASYKKDVNPLLLFGCP